MSDPTSHEARIDALTAERDSFRQMERARNADNTRLRKALHLAWGIIEWMSESPDFGPGGKAHEGWIKAQYDIGQIRTLLKDTGPAPKEGM